MKLIMGIVLNYNYNYIKTKLLPRLCRKSYHKNTVDYTWTLHTFPKSLKKYKYFLSYYRYETNAATVNKKIDIKCGVRPEHEIMHSIFENSVHYRNTVFPQFKIIPSITVEDITCLYTTCWSNESAKSILNALQKLAYCHLNESELELSYCVDILHSCTEKWKTWNNEQILKLMQSLIVLHKPLACVNNYEAFIKKLNNECLKRFYSSNTEQLLLLSDAFYQLNNITSDYMWRALRKLGTKPHKLSAKSLVHFLFLVTVPYIKIPINMFEIECHLINCLDELTVDEIGIVAKGFFLYKKHIQNKQLASAIIQILIKYSKTINSNSLGSVMKLLRYSGSNHDVILFQKLLEVLCKEIPRLQLPCLTAIAHATAGLRLYDEILINNIYKSLGNTLHSSRIKDIERILFALCTITPETDYYVAACNKIINHIMLTYTTYKAPEIHKFPSSLVRMLSFLTMKNIYIPELIQFIFDPKFMKNSLTIEYLILHCSIKIDLPNYEGPLLSENKYAFLTKKYSHDDEDIYRKDNCMQMKCEIVFICKNNLGLNVHVDYILPHYSSRDIVLGFDKYNNSVEIEPILSAMPMYSIKRVDSVELKTINWIILPILLKTVRVHGHEGYIGIIHRKLRQLKTIGYTPIPICQDIWNQCHNENKAKYLKSLIYQETFMFPNGVP